MPTSVIATGELIANSMGLCNGYGEKLVEDIPGGQFAHMPHPAMNHPAFCIGHLAHYDNSILELLGRSDLITKKPGYEELFKAGAVCMEQDGRYPAKDEIVAYYLDRGRVTIEAIATTDDATLARGNPAEGRFKQMCPTVGAAVDFLAGSHHMCHLGQLSAWRRAVGLPSVM